MKTILFPTDFSEDSFKALEFGLKYLISDSPEIIFINVYQIPAGAASGTFYLLEELKKQANEDMHKFVLKTHKAYPDLNLKITPKVLMGDFADQCNSVALQYHADCILVGTKGASGIKEVLVGSNTVSLIRGLKAPLFVIPFNFTENKMETFILTYDGDDYEINSKATIKKFAKWFDMPIKAIHIKTNQEKKIDWQSIKTLFHDMELSIEEIDNDSLEVGLKEITNQNEGVLCMVHHKQSFWESIFNISDSRKMVMHAAMPILVIPD
ncbi:MAG: universal stress protein [Bacteroidetes bacterium]|nr:MAG: universal stress protein [Bacteroidota bacterium]MBL1144284.1 universal stress protein [Bacteroidota bacterium]NOG57081.1 universal stress protein [Bacteroidota bacterium]